MKRTIAWILSGMLLFTALPTQAAFGADMAAVQFADMQALPQTHWSLNAVYTMAALGILQGNGTDFMPTGTTTRSEALAVLMRAAGLSDLAEATRRQVAANKLKSPSLYNQVDEWADGYIRLAVDYGILTVDRYNEVMSYAYTYDAASRTFEKEGAVTRLETVEWFVRIFGIPLADRADRILDYADYNTLPQDKQLYVETAIRCGLIQGDGVSLSLERTVSRQEVAQMLFNVRDLLCTALEIEKTETAVQSCSTETLETTDTEIKTQTTVLFENNEEHTVVRTYGLNGAAVDYSRFYETDTDVLTVKSGKTPNGLHILQDGDRVELYRKNGTLLLVLADYREKPLETVGEDFTEGTPITGTLYLADTENNRLIIQTADGLTEVPYFTGLQIYCRNQSVALDELLTNYLDYGAVVFTARSPSGTVYRAYRMQLFEK